MIDLLNEFFEDIEFDFEEPEDVVLFLQKGYINGIEVFSSKENQEEFINL